MNDKAIDDALELGITSCLQRLQKSKPSLLLNSSQLKKTEREVRFIPSVATALASIMINCENSAQEKDMMNIMRDWQMSPQNHGDLFLSPQNIGDIAIEEAKILTFDSLQSPTLDKHDEMINSCKDMSSELPEAIASRFHEVMNQIEERKVEQSKRVRAEYALKKKKVRCNDKSDGSTCTSVADLDDFFSQENDASSTHTDCSHSDANMDDKDDKESEGGVLETKDEDFDDDDWW